MLPGSLGRSGKETDSISVWDEGRTKVSEALAFRPTRPLVVFRLSATRRKNLQQRFQSIQVLYEPVDVTQQHKPGADGHAGLYGVIKPTKNAQTKQHYVLVRDEMAREFEFVELAE